MQIHTTDRPAKIAAEHVSRVISEHDGDVLCLLSGGSALDVVEHINTTNKPECRTIYLLRHTNIVQTAYINHPYIALCVITTVYTGL